MDVEATEARLRTYERANFADIAAKEARKVRAHQAAPVCLHSGALQEFVVYPGQIPVIYRS